MIIVGYYEEKSKYCSPTMWQRLAIMFGAELHLINEHHRKGFQNLQGVLDMYSHRPWVRLTPHDGEMLQDFQHPEDDQVVYFVGPDAQPCPPIPGAYDVTLPADRELHAFTAMAITMWDRKLYNGLRIRK